MNNKVSDICRDLGSMFVTLAEELEKQQNENEMRMTQLEYMAHDNRDALKDAASAILARFE